LIAAFHTGRQLLLAAGRSDPCGESYYSSKMCTVMDKEEGEAVGRAITPHLYPRFLYSPFVVCLVGLPSATASCYKWSV
jgi:hypothetical protein